MVQEIYQDQSFPLKNPVDPSATCEKSELSIAAGNGKIPPICISCNLHEISSRSKFENERLAN